MDLDLAGSFTPLTASSEETIAVTVVAATEAETTDDSETGRVLRKLVNDEALNDELDEEVDLHDLIKPLASIGNLQLAVVDTAVGASSGGAGSSNIIQEMDTRDLNEIFSAAQVELEAQSALMASALDNKEVAGSHRSAASRALFGTSTGVSTGLSVDYLLCLIRGGTLMGSVLS
ncbi:MAG: hypothetical protein ACI8UP_005124 [Porticoccaceae bacterium]